MRGWRSCSSACKEVRAVACGSRLSFRAAGALGVRAAIATAVPGRCRAKAAVFAVGTALGFQIERAVRGSQLAQILRVDPCRARPELLEIRIHAADFDLAQDAAVTVSLLPLDD